MSRQSLDGAWEFREAGSCRKAAGEWLPATVPGGVHLDLLAAGKIDDPFVGDEERRVQWVADRCWEYRRRFDVQPEISGEQRLELVFDGLDTLAEIRLNGELLGEADNTFRTWRWDVTGRLRSGRRYSSPGLRLSCRRSGRLGCPGRERLGSRRERLGSRNRSS